MSDRKRKVVALLKSIETGETAPVAAINPDRYIQHSPAVGDGLAGFAAVLAQLPSGAARVATARVIEDGDFVVAHTDYNFFGPKIGFDIFRFENDRIVEHWDNLQEKPDRLNPSGRSMIDGPTDIKDTDRTAENKAFVRSFVETVLVKGEIAALPSFFNGDRYVQHNPQVADGLSGLASALDAMAKQGISMEYHTVHRVLGEGNMVLVVSEGRFAGEHVAYYDLFRVERGVIAEHWDTIERIPPVEEHKNGNGKF
jgi:predicted SnoaL-like aldol condensation-catalyzing enzyme